MKIEEAIRLMKFMRNGYQKLIDENCAEGEVVGTDVTGTWKSSTPLTEVYQKHIDACDMAIKALEKQIPVKPLRRKATFDRSINKLYCPVCKKYLGHENYRTRSVSNQSGDYCDCGQKNSWWR